MTGIAVRQYTVSPIAGVIPDRAYLLSFDVRQSGIFRYVHNAYLHVISSGRETIVPPA